jgi:hypothetical protein
MNDIVITNIPQIGNIRVLFEDKEPYFVAEYVASCMGLFDDIEHGLDGSAYERMSQLDRYIMRIPPKDTIEKDISVFGTSMSIKMITLTKYGFDCFLQLTVMEPHLRAYLERMNPLGKDKLDEKVLKGDKHDSTKRRTKGLLFRCFWKDKGYY